MRDFVEPPKTGGFFYGKTMERLITLPKLGIKVLPPYETQQNIAKAQRGEKVVWGDYEKARLKLIANSKILKRRYPSPEHGKAFMENVEYERLSRLQALGLRFKENILDEWRRINPQKPVAIILYGSVARGLVKASYHPHPSDIDLAVFGYFFNFERVRLLENLELIRQEIGSEVVNGCNQSHLEPIRNYAGLKVQNIDKLVINNYSTALDYIRAHATTLHDPAELWARVEHNALNKFLGKQVGESPYVSKNNDSFTIYEFPVTKYVSTPNFL